MRCDRCGATNPDTAAWCGQCYTGLGSDGPRSDGPRSDGPRSDGPCAGDPEVAAVAPSVSVDQVPLAEGAFRREGDRLVWVCPTCERDNELADAVCAACATPFAARLATPVRELPAETWASARVRSMVLPGLGHVLIGRTLTGLARGLLFAVWLGGGLLLIVGAGGGVRGGVPALPLLFGAAVVHLATLDDVGRARAGQPERLAGRGMLWLVVGVTLGVLVAFGLAALLFGGPTGEAAA